MNKVIEAILEEEERKSLGSDLNMNMLNDKNVHIEVSAA